MKKSNGVIIYLRVPKSMNRKIEKIVGLTGKTKTEVIRERIKL